MGGRTKFALAVAASLGFVAVALAVVVAAFWVDAPADHKAVLLARAADRAGLAIYGLLVVAVALGLALRRVFAAYVGAPARFAEQVRILAGPNRAHRLAQDGASELDALAEAINRLADQRDALERDVERRIEAAGRSLAEERNRLAALMSELTQSVVVCNLDGRILLYNQRARLQFMALAEGASGPVLIGLGRSIFSVVDRALITHALDNVQHRLGRGSSHPVAQFVTATRAGQLIRVQMAPVLGEAGEPGAAQGAREVRGYVLILDNITRSFETDSRRDQMLHDLTEGSRASIASVRAAVETLMSYPDMDSAQRERFVGIIAEEVGVLSTRLDRTVSEHADSLKARWPLEEMLAADFLDAAARRIGQRVELAAKIEEVAPELWIKVDSFSLLQALSYLAARLKEEFAVREIRLRLVPAGRLAHLDLIWSGAVVGTETAMSWELEPMQLGGEATPLTLRDIMDRHGGEIWFQRDKAAHRALFRFLVPAAAPPAGLEDGAAASIESRPEYYDFDLFRATGEYAELEDRPLAHLAYTVFDTETTGLAPSAGDEIIQIGAVRIVNGRLLQHESYEQLIDPRRPLASESVKIHGITAPMLRGQPTIERVLPGFHAYCEDTVLVAHNAAFDMRFLQLKEEATGVRFTQPVLDTLLLSPVIHPNQESHRLEAIAERLGVNVIGRHTALGDAILTAEVFLRMLPLLAEQGIVTLRQAREAAEQTYYARIRY